MNVVVITGSPHRDGTSALMAREFIRGAEKAGHAVYRFDAALKEVHPCIGCDKCGCGKHPCVFSDDMEELYGKLKEAEAVVYCSPLYYHNVSAQLKTVIDRYHGIDDLIRGTGKSVFTIITAAYPEDWVFDGVKATIRTTARYLGWKDCGGIFAYGCYRKEDIEKTDYPRQAFALGEDLERMMDCDAHRSKHS